MDGEELAILNSREEWANFAPAQPRVAWDTKMADNLGHAPHRRTTRIRRIPTGMDYMTAERQAMTTTGWILIKTAAG